MRWKQVADPMFSYATESSWAIECTLEAAGFSNALARSLFEGTIKAQVKFPGKSVDDKEVFPTVLVHEEVYKKSQSFCGPRFCGALRQSPGLKYWHR